MKHKCNKKWWWYLLHPFLAIRINKWVRETEKLFRIELDNMDFNNKLEKMLVDGMCCGTAKIFIPKKEV